MKNAIWSTCDHYRSTDKHPCNSRCPTGSDSWCTWQRPRAEGLLKAFKHDYKPLPVEVLKIIQPIYENLSKDAQLERCVSGFNQNNNESYNHLISKIAEKTLHYSNSCIFGCHTFQRRQYCHISEDFRRTWSTMRCQHPRVCNA